MDIRNTYYNKIRNVLSICCDTDTIGAIAGAIATAYYGLPDMVTQQVLRYKPELIFDDALSSLGKEKS